MAGVGIDTVRAPPAGTLGDDAHAPPEDGSSPSKCSCGAEVERPGDEYCKTCFEAALDEALTAIDLGENTLPAITDASFGVPTPTA
jgi:hypothetical protein